ncbi:hypothetical protein BVZ80_00130B, partial [Haemophilus influenzae]
GLFNA